MKIEAGNRTDGSNRTKGVSDSDASFFTKLMFRRVKRRYGHVPLPTRILANEPELLVLFQRMNKFTHDKPGSVPPTLKELVQLKVAAMVGCPF